MLWRRPHDEDDKGVVDEAPGEVRRRRSSRETAIETVNAFTSCRERP